MVDTNKRYPLWGKKRVIGFLLLMFVIAGGFTIVRQDDFTDEKRAKYICGFIRQITWPQKEKKLSMGVLESDTKLSDEVRRQAIPENLRDKSLTVLSLKNLKDLPKLHLLYVNASRNPEANIDSLMAVLERKGVLLITEAGMFGQSMINFVAVEDKTFYEVDEQALKKAGFTYMQILPNAAIKTEEDWKAKSMKNERELKAEKDTTARQREKIAIHEQEIARQKEEISKNEAKITGMTAEIESKQDQIDRQRNRLASLTSDIAAKQKELKDRDEEIDQQILLIAEKQKAIDEQSRLNARYSDEIAEKQTQIGGLNTQINQQLAKLKMQNVIIVLGGLLLVFLTVFGIYAYRNYKQKQRTNRILQAQNEEITEQRDRIAQQNKEITDSIVYARRIQKAILPKRKMMQEYIDMFIFNRPRNIVSGDFYWMSKKDDKLIIVAADCTGHGVPGAFMSMLGIAFLNEIVGKESEVYANEILNKLRDHVVRSLHQTGKSEEEDTKDGMDIALCVIDYPSMTLQYAGAYNPLILIRNNDLMEIKADKMPVAYSDAHGNKAFTNNLVPVVQGDCIYMFSDGYADQFGGYEEKSKKFSSKRLKTTLLKVSDLPMKEQEKTIAQKYDEWKGHHEQVDDVLLVGVKV